MRKRGSYLKGRFSFIFVLMMVLAVIAGGCGKSAAPTIVENAISVSLAAVAEQGISQNVGYTGTVRGINETRIFPKASSRVTAIHVQAGGMVRRGQVLISLDSSDYQVGVQTAEAVLASARAALDSAEAAKIRNDIDLANARTNYDRVKQLYDSGAVSVQSLEEVQTALDKLNSGSIEAEIARAQAGYRQAEAGLAQARIQVNNCSVTSPIDGMVGSISVSLGDTCTMQSPVASITNISQLEVAIYANEAEISYIKAGDAAEVYIKAASEQPFYGQVTSVATVPETGRSSYLVKIVLDNPGQVIRSGMFAEVYLDTVSKENVLALPINAIISKGGRMVVFTVDQDQRAREKEVTTGLKDKEYIEITGGLQAGQEVIYLGNSLVSDGSLVKVTAGGER